MREIFVVAAACCTIAGAGMAQSPVLDTINPFGEGPGVHVSDVSVGSAYYSRGLSNASLFTPGAAALKGDGAITAAATLEFLRIGRRSDLSITYSPSYYSRFRYTDLTGLNHSLNIAYSKALARKWTAMFTADGSAENLGRMLFSPLLLSRVAALPATFDQLAAAMTGGQYSDAQLASLLTGAPIIQSPAQTMLYGDRMLMAAATAGVQYSFSPRLQIDISVGASRMQNLPVKTGTTLGPVLGRTTAGLATLNASYSISPRTTASLAVSSTRIFSSAQQSYNSLLQGTLGRTMGRRWFAELKAGIGVVNPITSRYPIIQKPRYVAGAEMGYKARAHTFLISGERTMMDYYGLGTDSTINAMAAWRWSRPGSNWMAFADFGQQKMHGRVTSINTAHGDAGITRSLSAELALTFNYGYMSYKGQLAMTPYDVAQDGLTMNLTWAPRRVHGR